MQNLADNNAPMSGISNGITTPAIGVVIVIYNKRCEESVSVIAVSKIQLTAFALVDNSTDKEIADSNKDFCRRNKTDYYSMDGNAGLPKAYNRGFRGIGHRVDYLMFLDDDTTVPWDCMQSLQDAISKNPTADVYLPFVYDAKGLLSPNRRMGSLFFRLHQPPDSFTGKMSAINSGLVIRTASNRDSEELFDESQFLDSVDHLFVFKQIHKGNTFQLYSANFLQTFFDQSSKNQINQLERTYSRFSLFVKDYLYFCRVCSLNLLSARLYLVFRAVKLSLRYKTIRFFRALCENKKKQNENRTFTC